MSDTVVQTPARRKRSLFAALAISDKLQLISSGFFGQAARILTTLVMARLISPKDNGTYLLVLSVTSLVNSFGNLGIPSSLVRLRDFPERVLVDTATVMAFLLNGFYALTCVIGGVYLSNKYGDPRFWKIAVMIAAANWLGGLYDVQLAQINRQLQFRSESVQNLIMATATAVTGITFACMGYGVMALALQGLVGQLIPSIFIMRRVPLRLPRQASFAACRRFLRLGLPLSLSYYAGNGESAIINLVINSAFGQSALGAWGKAVQIQQLFAQNLLMPFERVAYPMLCHNIANPERMPGLIRRAAATEMLCGGFFAALLFANNHAIVRLILGPMWMQVTPSLLQVTSLAVPAGTFISLAFMLCMITGSTITMVKVLLGNLVVFIPAALLCRHAGLPVLAGCWSTSRYLIGFGILAITLRTLHVRIRQLLRDTLPMLISAAVAAAAMCVINRLLTTHLPLLIEFTISSTIGAMIYVGILAVVARDALAYAVRLARHKSDPESPPVPVESPTAAPLATACDTSMLPPTG